ncbi:hypothetical protein BDW02DRAFT_508940 [Decorospora gaudefroyi]|uniref:Mid2 domain-containing protein n=1 Tax=Decorospora gaudefroyi TaxID=184978 RepID=A0A6A5JY65_9PLEO|nr:hypothetical protein BDW02DRAFT_508940 [Decorospora gaudefroyi]
MAFIRNLLLLCAVSWTHAAATPLDTSMRVRNAPGHTTEDTYRAIRRGLAAAVLEKREIPKAELPLARSWNGATLLSVQLPEQTIQSGQNSSLEVQAGIEVTCQTCYVKGFATAELTIDEEFNATELIEQTVDSVRNETIQFATDFKDYLLNYIKDVTSNIQDVDFPTFPFAFDLDIPEIPECNLRFQFDDMELYLEIDTSLSAGATYEINLFASQTAVGMKIGPLLQLGAVLQVDLILEVEGAIDISSGFHIKLDDGVAMDLTLFGKNVSNMIFNGGQFEFLPVTIESADVSISAVLRIGIHCGIEVDQGEVPTLDAVIEAVNPFDITAGVEVAVFAHVAEFITNVTYDDEAEDCKLKVVQEYNLAVGAMAGASILVDVPFLENMTWGAVAETSTAIYTTTLAEVCGIQAATTAQSIDAPSATAAEKRQDLTTTTLSTETVTTGISCKVTNKPNCPNSEEVSIRATITRYHTTAVPSGETPTFPDTAFTSVGSTVPFGSHVQSIVPMSGVPTAYTAPPASQDGGAKKSSTLSQDGGAKKSSTLDGETGGVSNKVIIGVCVGLVGAVLIAIAAGVLFWRRRKRYAAVESAAAPMVAQSYTGHDDYGYEFQNAKGAGAHVTEVRR